MTDEAVKDVGPKYFGNVLSAFEAGVQMDLRVRLAIDIIKAGVITADTTQHRAVAECALNMACDLLDGAAARGLLKDLPDNGDINVPTRHHVERTVRANAHGQVVGQRIMREESGVVAPAGASVMHPGMLG